MTTSTAINNILTRHPQHMIDPKANSYDWGLVNDHPDVERMLQSAKQFATGILLNESPRWLTLLGKSSTGKTELSKRLLKYWRERLGWKQAPGKDGMTLDRLGDSRFISWDLHLGRLRNRQNEIDSIAALPFCVIDDIGTDDGSPQAKAALYSLLNCRVGKWTVITANIGMLELGKIDARITSRMIRGESVVVETQVEDWNLRRRKV